MEIQQKRIRAKCYLLEYPTLVSENKLKQQLMKIFNVKEDKDWKYIIKTEH